MGSAPHSQSWCRSNSELPAGALEEPFGGHGPNWSPTAERLAEKWPHPPRAQSGTTWSHKPWKQPGPSCVSCGRERGPGQGWLFAQAQRPQAACGPSPLSRALCGEGLGAGLMGGAFSPRVRWSVTVGIARLRNSVTSILKQAFGEQKPRALGWRAAGPLPSPVLKFPLSQRCSPGLGAQREGLRGDPCIRAREAPGRARLEDPHSLSRKEAQLIPPPIPWS